MFDTVVEQLLTAHPDDRFVRQRLQAVLIFCPVIVVRAAESVSHPASTTKGGFEHEDEPHDLRSLNVYRDN